MMRLILLILLLAPTSTFAQEGRRESLGFPTPESGEALGPADSLFRAAREALNAGNYRRGADMFKELVDRHPNSSFAADALYWRAYALYRDGVERRNTSSLQAASAALTARNRYTGRTAIPDAVDLAMRISSATAALRQGVPVAARPPVADSSRACFPASEDPRSAAVNTLRRMSPAMAVPVLKAILADTGNCMEPVRKLALGILGAIDTAAAIPMLFSVATSDPSAAIRAEAFAMIGRIDRPEALTILDSVARRGGDPYARRDAVQALRGQPYALAASVLRGIADDPSTPAELRARALGALSVARPQGERSFLANLARTRDPGVTPAEIAAAQNDRTGLDSERFLRDFALNTRARDEMRRTAVRLLAERRVEPSIMIELYDRLEGTVDLQAAALGHFRNYPQPEVTRKLLEIARSGGHQSLARIALDQLASRNEPEAVEILRRRIQLPR